MIEIKYKEESKTFNTMTEAVSHLRMNTELLRTSFLLLIENQKELANRYTIHHFLSSFKDK